MKKSKVFLIIAIIFILIIFYVVYDMATRTSFPTAKPGTSAIKEDSTKNNDSLEIEIRR